MGFRDLPLRQAYDSGDGNCNPLNEFYIPVLSECMQYDRLTGYFSSQVLALAAKGIAKLIQNGGKMRLITSADFSLEDYEVLLHFNRNSLDQLISERFERALSSEDQLSDLFTSSHIEALAWMLKSGKLEIRVLIPSQSLGKKGIFHSKVGILRDMYGDRISFSGSVNETAAGWYANVEEFKVFREWTSSERKFVDHDIAAFERYWTPSGETEFISIPLPTAARDNLISKAPESIEELRVVRAEIESEQTETVSLRSYQVDAIEAWRAHEYVGLLAMATGTGKTRTALGCIEASVETAKKSLIVISAPQLEIAGQWFSLLSEFAPIFVKGGGRWREELGQVRTALRIGTKKIAVIIGVQNSLSGPEFLSWIDSMENVADARLLIADEAHGLGSKEFSKLLSPVFNRRLGLSATPERWHDEEGTGKLFEFFGSQVFEFGIHEALLWRDPVTGARALCDYEYWPTFLDLTLDEHEEYRLLTRRISQRAARANEEDSLVKLLRIQRAKVLKNAEAKLQFLRTLLEKTPNLNGTLIYCSETEQLEAVATLLGDMGITFRKFTGDESSVASPKWSGLSERQWIMRDFESGSVKVLLAMKCLDEGVDIPSAKLAFILASNSNPREFIQRRGRLLRTFPGKDKAIIHDLVVFPASGDFERNQDAEYEIKMAIGEIKRINEFSSDALNKSKVIATVVGKLLEYGG